MSRFSVVVPAHRVQGYLRECLDSVLDQSFGDLELIVVDDASPDASAAIAAQCAERDPRVQLVRAPAQAGAGPARNIGADRATGTYLLFLDGDDLLLPGALEAIAAALDRADDPDVLLTGHDRVDWWENVRAGGDDLTGDPVAVTVAAWNRVFRRVFWQRHRLTFSDGPYEDVIPVHRATLAAGARVAALDEPCVRWRERRGGSFAKSPGRAHFAVVGRYEELLSAADPAGRERLLPHAAAHLLAVLDDPGRIAPGDRRDFFRAASRLYRTYATAPPAAAGEQALAAASYAAHETQRKRASRRGGVARQLKRQKKKLRARAMRVTYATDLRRPLDPRLAVYGAYWNRGISCNPAAIHAKARELAPHIKGVWVVSSRNKHRVPDGVEYVIEGSRSYWQTMARATYLINNSSFPGGFTKRPGQVYLQTHHGTPLKKMGLDQRRYPAGTHGISFQKVLDHTDQWDLSLSANPHSTEVWERVYPSTSYESLEAGYPRNDVYFTAGESEVVRIREELGVADGRTVLLYAPTHRDYQKGFLPRLDLERFVRALGPSYVVLVRAHYFYGAEAGLRAHPRLIDVTGHARVEDLCLAADALVTDYSSLMFDYACLDRPIVTYAPDWQAYRLARGTYFDLLSGRPGETPGAVATNEGELIELFRGGSWDGEEAAGLRSAFRERFCPYDDGGAAGRVVRRLFLEGQAPRS
ncbi:bifunctional glycosyltransferase family 2 protein/CDP-glycerol:glycerophosphate glycerophosphotransferase [Streptomyces sp. MZ04]|uniref:bifunctional glycosyltransferase/CDP-glycerol:glycerophosphate glycerophosphotransferase n=1 Tax=Streptomyces sp. MZ04 TaxID=2559236 RepID=UPI00107E7E8D|nr:bifunctional glycosyltransferase family 2 protein/CDP-glycerol:glycerophosphate glycerophosphotransferase [Streptomyces sp. MZ04]TGA92562.1 CDP-glycerol:glycerophosphate glycerophosphotransferase [Streptomyces sp. MZ04]